MNPSVPIEELEIIGYAEKLTDETVPTIVVPIFAYKADGDKILFPPFRIYQGSVSGGYFGNRAEFNRQVIQNAATKIEKPLQAQPEFELWVDKSFKPHYERIDTVLRTLGEIAKESTADALKLLEEGLLEEADRCLNYAISADDRSVEPFAVRAAIRHKQNNEPGARVMVRLKGDLVSDAGFESLVAGYEKRIVSNRMKINGMKGAAKKKPKDVLPQAAGWQ